MGHQFGPPPKRSTAVMKLLAIAALFAIFAQSDAAACDDSIAEIKDQVTSILSDASMKKILPMLIAYTKKNIPLQQAFDEEYACFQQNKGSQCLVNQCITGVPSTQYLVLFGVFTKFMSCFDKAKYTIDQAKAALSSTMLKKLNPPYEECRTKANQMWAAKKAEADVTTQMCTMINDKLSQPLVQDIITSAKNIINKANPAAWACVTAAAPKVMTKSGLYKW